MSVERWHLWASRDASCGILSFSMNDILAALRRYWPAVVAAVAFVTALLTAVSKWQTVRKNRREEKLMAAEESRTSVGVVFEKVRIDSQNWYWMEWTPPESTIATGKLPIRNSSCKQFFHINQVVANSDPSFDVILRNDGRGQASILAVGIRVLRVAHYSYELPVAGSIEEARKLNTSEAYWLDMPNIRRQTLHFDFDEDDPPAEINQLIQKNCDPYILPPDGRFRYTLVLRGYANMPNNVILRMWVDTSDGARESNDMYLRYALGFR